VRLCASETNMKMPWMTKCASITAVSPSDTGGTVRRNENATARSSGNGMGLMTTTVTSATAAIRAARLQTI